MSSNLIQMGNEIIGSVDAVNIVGGCEEGALFRLDRLSQLDNIFQAGRLVDVGYT